MNKLTLLLYICIYLNNFPILFAVIYFISRNKGQSLHRYTVQGLKLQLLDNLLQSLLKILKILSTLVFMEERTFPTDHSLLFEALR